MSKDAINDLKRATKGLLYTSESDEPFRTFTWKGEGTLTAEKLLQLAKHEAGEKVEEISLDDFFGDLTEEQDWHGDEEKETVQKYKKLREAIEGRLSDVKVFRVGEPNIDIYIVGKTDTGDWAGVQTKAVET
jgi:hypothetical protein